MLDGAGAVDEVVPGGGTEGTEGCGLVDAARLLASVLFVICSNLGITLFYLTVPLIPASSTILVTSEGNGICRFAREYCKNSLIAHHMTSA